MIKWKSMLALLACVTLSFPVAALDGGIEGLRQSGKAFASVAKAVSPSVVNIQVEGRTAAAESGGGSQGPFGDQFPFGDELFRRFFGDRLPGVPRQETPQRSRRTISQGSGFVFASKDGLLSDRSYVLTNNHVVEGASKIRVKLLDGRELEAKVTGRDPQSDVAVIEIPTGGLPALALADASKLEVGEWVIAIGNPFGLQHTVTVGVVSATGRTTLGINDYEDFIQTDAAINPGNSGGPLVNLDGQVVGMNTAIFSRSGGYMGVGFAIPSNLLQGIANQLIGSGKVTRGFLGILIQSLTPDLAESFGLDQAQGILIAQVNADSPAAKGGLRQGDVILELDGEPVSDVGAFRNRVSLTSPGTAIRLTILRDGKRQELSVAVGTLSEDQVAAAGGTQSAESLGLSVQTLTPQLAEQFEGTPGEGVVVTEVQPGSVAALAGITPGTLILQVNREPVGDAAAFARAVEQAKEKRVLLLVRKDGAQRFVVLSW
jgi:serine protease Do